MIHYISVFVSHFYTMWITLLRGAPVGHSKVFNLTLCYFILILTYPPYIHGVRKPRSGVHVPGGRESVPGDTDAIQRLSKVFGIDNVPRHNVKATPPQFMMELFNDITDYGGLIRKDGPYNASTIVSFPDQGKPSVEKASVGLILCLVVWERVNQKEMAKVKLTFFQRKGLNYGKQSDQLWNEIFMVRINPQTVTYYVRAYTQDLHFHYNVSKHSEDHLLESEFHVYRISPRLNNSRTLLTHNSRLSHIIEVQIYQVLDPNNMYSDRGRHLLDKRRISAHTRGWMIFNVTRAVREWVSGVMENYGLLVISRTVQGQDLGVDEVRFAQRNAHHDSKQPILVVYTNDGRARTPHYISPQDTEYKQIRKDIKRQERRYTKKHQYNYDSKGFQNTLKLLNEKTREEYGHPFFIRKTHTNIVDTRKKRSAVVQNDNETSDRRRKQRRNKRNRKNKKDKGKRGIEPRYSRQRKSCTRRHMYVDFDEIGWEGWIISPKGYNAYHCKGECPFPLGQSQRPTNHATVQSIVHALKVGKGVSTPCCVPNKLYSISLLYFDDAENVILKQYDDMVAASCGCH